MSHDGGTFPCASKLNQAQATSSKLTRCVLPDLRGSEGPRCRRKRHRKSTARTARSCVRTLICLLDRRHHAEREVKRQHALRVEAWATDCRAVTGEWLERP